jgi:hypothetical protein
MFWRSFFREFCEFTKETRVEKGCEIAMAHCRSFPGFQMMEILRVCGSNFGHQSPPFSFLDTRIWCLK